jgi:uncharacterized protein YdaU (DUF1376 family)
MSGNSLAMMPWFPRDFLASTRAMRLIERGAYSELLFYQWEMGSLPADTEQLARLLGCTEKEFTAIWKVVSKKFVLAGDTLSNQRLEEHRGKAIEARDKKVLGAQKTNAKRSAERDPEPPAKRNGERPAERDAKRHDIVTPPSPSPSPSPKSISNLTHTSEVSSSVRADSEPGKGSVCGTFTKIGGEKPPTRVRDGPIPTTAEVMNQLRRENGRAGK